MEIPSGGPEPATLYTTSVPLDPDSTGSRTLNVVKLFASRNPAHTNKVFDYSTLVAVTSDSSTVTTSKPMTELTAVRADRVLLVV